MNKRIISKGKMNQELILLENILDKHNISRAYYSLNGYSEECVCLEMIYPQKYVVYFAERNQRTDVQQYWNFADAGIDLIRRIVIDKRVCSDIQRELIREIRRNSFVSIRKKPVRIKNVKSLKKGSL